LYISDKLSKLVSLFPKYMSELGVRDDLGVTCKIFPLGYTGFEGDKGLKERYQFVFG
jgi:hypothetical protein